MGVLFTSFPKEGSEVIPGVESFCQARCWNFLAWLGCRKTRCLFFDGKRGLKCLMLLDGFSFLPSDKVSLLSGNIQMAEIGLISKDNA
ncbi:hypothetical protein JHK82_042837 [Glycine max]|nr:hypothetical protein JHK82_042837 [Glycine max]